MNPAIAVPQRVPRAISRDRVRSSLEAAARALFDELGFDAATTSQIAARAGVSQRTLFRHFACKEDVALGWLDGWNARICERLRRRPESELPLEALRRALDPFCHMPAEDSARSRWIRSLASSSPPLSARLLAKQAEWGAHIASELAGRGVARIQAAFLGTFAIGVLQVAFREATSNAAADIEGLIDEGFAILRGGPTRPVASNDA